VPPRKRRKKAESQSRGLTPEQVGAGSPTAPAEALRRAVEEDGGQVLAVFRDPLGGNWQILAALPIDKVQPTPYQRDLSESHVKRLTAVIDALDRFLDPIIAVRGAEGGYWTPNGNHRLAAVRNLGGRSILALVLADPQVAYKILALIPRRRTTCARSRSRSSAWPATSPGSGTPPRRTSHSSSRSRRF